MSNCKVNICETCGFSIAVHMIHGGVLRCPVPDYPEDDEAYADRKSITTKEADDNESSSDT